jgi:hypothetical protein
MSNQISLAIKLNNYSTSEHCVLCNTETEVHSSPELFLIDGYKVVCRSCGRRYAPVLVSLLDLAQSAKSYSNMLMELSSTDGP